jgi:hypothetical protein
VIREGDTVNVRCSDCGSKDVVISEQFNVYDQYVVKAGRVVEICGCVMPQATGALRADCCRCGKEWRMRRSIHGLANTTTGGKDG